MNSNKYIFWLYPFIILIVTVAVYIPTFTGDFLLDDHPLIEKNRYIKKSHSIYSYLAQEDGITDKDDHGRFHTGYYRPLINMTYRFDYILWGMNAPGFRLTNLALHLLCCLALLHLINLLIKDYKSAFCVTLLFALHPVNTESVSWIISRNNMLVTLFTIFSFIFYINLWEKRSYLSGIISVLSFAGAVLSKEFGIMVLPVFFFYNRMLSKRKRSVLFEISSYIPFIIILAVYFLLRRGVTGAFLSPFGALSLCSHIYFIPFLVIWNLKLVFLPYGLHFLYVTYPESFVHWRAVGPIILFFITVIFLIKLRKKRVLLFSCYSFFIFIFPVLNLIPSASTSVTLVALRWLYIPMAFLCVGMAWVVNRALIRRYLLTLSILGATLLYLGSHTYIMNRSLWHNEYSFFKQEVNGFGNDFFAGDLAEKYFEFGEYEKAEKYFKIALEKYPSQVYHYINYSALLIDTGRPAMAVSQLKEAGKLNMTKHKTGEWFNNMGLALIRLGNKAEGLSHLEKATIYAPDESAFWVNLGSAYAIEGNYLASIRVLLKGLGVLPESVEIRKTLAKGYINIKDFEKALLLLEKIPENDRNNDNDIFDLLLISKKGAGNSMGLDRSVIPGKMK